jgi:methyl-accepting chemotaxis protein
MQLNDLKIGVRLATLAGFLLLSTVIVGGIAIASLKADQAEFESSHVLADEFETAIDTARAAQVQFKIQIQEWKNLLLRGGDAAAFEKYSKAFAKEGDVVQGKLQALKQSFSKLNLPSGSVDEAVTELNTLTVKYNAALTHYDKSSSDKSAHEVDALVKGMDRAPTKRIDAIVEATLKASDQNRTDMLSRVEARMRTAWITMFAVLMLALTMGVAASWLILRSITRPLQQAVLMATDVAEGKLNGHIRVDGQDEISQLTSAMCRMNDSLLQVVSQVRDAAGSVAHASSEIASGNMDLSGRTEVQASNLQQTAATIDQLSTGVKHSADNAAQAHDLATQANEVAERGGTVVANVVQTMNDINASSRKISEIIGVIDGIAFQTNILALNAAVEAARAGEQGRGFAVVASEVRALAQRSANAAKEIKTLINASVECVDRGTDLVGEAGDTITSTMDAVRRVRDVISEITAATREQAAGVTQVSQSIGAIDNTMQQNAALVEQAAAAASSLQQQAQALTQSVAFFQT